MMEYHQAETASVCLHLGKNSIAQSRCHVTLLKTCKILCEVDSATIVLTGGTPEGMNAESGVFEYSGLGGENVTSLNHKMQKVETRQDSGLAIRELPSLLHPRFGHACGQYTFGDSQVKLYSSFAAMQWLVYYI